MYCQFGCVKGELIHNCWHMKCMRLNFLGELVNVWLLFSVIRGSDLPGLDHSGLSDPYVVVSLYPKTMFGHNKPQKTKIIEQTLNPVFNTTFQL